MSTTAKAHPPPDTTVEAFSACTGIWDDGECYELVDGCRVRPQPEQISHAEHELSPMLALRRGFKEAGSHAFPDGASVRVGAHTVRKPDALVHCGRNDRIPGRGDVVDLFPPDFCVAVEPVFDS